MQRVKFSLACLLCLSMVGSAAAQSVIETDSGVAALEDYSGGVSFGGAYFDVRTMTGDGVGYRNGFTQLGVTVPIWATEDMFVAPNARLLITDTSEIGTNLGVLARRYNPNFDRVFGVYGYYDFDHSAEGFDYNQFSFGFDTLGDRWDARANVYVPTTSDTNFVRAVSVGNDPIFFGNSLGFIGTGLFQESVAGADFEFGIPLSKSTPWLRGFAGAYFYESNGDEDLIGPRARIEAWVSDDLSVGVNVTDDDVSGTNVNAVVDFRFSGWKPTRYFPQWTTRERMSMPVQRNWRVSTPNYTDNVQVAAKNTATGNNYFIVHVDHSNTEAGDGTFENPFRNLPNAAPGADIILVQADGSSLLDPIRGSIVLENNQRLLGEGKAYSADVTVCFADLPMFDRTITLPGINADGNYPFMSSLLGNTVTLASNNQVAGFNLVNAGGFAITNNPLPGFTNNFDLQCLNITGNNGGIFLSNATGTGIINDVTALNNTLGGISIESGLTPLNLTMTDIVSSSLPAGTQALGVELIAGPGTINATITDAQINRNTDGLLLTGNAGDLNVTVTNASIDDSLNDGVRITGTDSNINLRLQDVTVNRSNGEGIEADTTNGSLTILGRNVTANNSVSDNVNLALTNSAMNIDFANSLFSGSTSGSGFVLNNNGGTGNLILNTVSASGNNLDGLSFSGDNFADIDGDVTFSAFNNNRRDAIFVSSTNTADVDLDIATVSATGSGRHGLNFNATTNGTLSITSLVSTFNNSGSIDPTGNGVNGFVDNAFVDVTMIGTTAANSGNHGMFVTAQNNADVSISVNQGNFQNSGQMTPGVGDAVNIVTDTGANLVLQINNTPMNNVNGNVTQDDGFVIDVSNTSTALVNISNSDLSDNTSNAIQATVDTNATVTINLLDITAERSGEDGILFNVQTAGTLNINASTLNTNSNSFDDSGAGGTGDGIDGFVRTDGDVNFNFTDTTFRRSAENGFLLDISDVGSTFTGTFTNGDFSDSGEAMLGVGQQDAFNVTAANSAAATINLFNTPSFNTSTPPLGTQQRGLFATVSSDADFVFFNQDGNMSNNLLNAINVNVTGVGSTADVTLVGTVTGAPLLASGSGEDGFIFVVNDSGDLDAVFQNASLDSSGVLGVLAMGMMGSDFDAIDGTIDTSGDVTLMFMDTLVTNAFNDGMEIDATNLGQLTAVFDNSPLDNSGTNNFGDALRLTFASGADGVVTLQNGTTAVNAGDDAAFISATGLGTSVRLNSLVSDLSDSGTTATANGANGIQALVSNDALVTLDIQDTIISNTNPTLPQLRGLSFDVQSGGQLNGMFMNSVLNSHDLHGISGSVDGTSVADSLAVLTLVDTQVDGNANFGAILTATNQGDLVLDLSGNGGLSSVSNNGAVGISASVDGADSTGAFIFNTTSINGNGNLVGGDGVVISATNTAFVTGAANASSISNNANGGLVLTVDNSIADFGVGMITNPFTGNTVQSGYFDTVIDGNGNEGILALADNGSELDFNMTFGAVGSSVSNNGGAGTAGDLNNSFDNVRIQATTGSDVEVQFVQTVADGATRNGFNFISQDSVFLAQLRAGVSASGNTGGSGVRFNATGATTQAVLFMSDTSADGLLTGTNAFDNNGTEPTLINTPTDPIDGFPHVGAGVIFNATNVDVAGVRFAGGASNNGNAADPLATRDIDGDGDGDDDGVFINIDTANLAAVEFAGMGAISGNVDDAIDLQLANITLLDVVTQPSELTPPNVVIGAAGPGIIFEDLILDGNGGGLKVVLDTVDLNGNDIIIRNNDITNNASGDGVLLDLDTVANIDEIVFQNNNIANNGTNAAARGHGVNLQLDTSPVAAIRFIGLAPAGVAGAIPQSITGNGLDGVHLEFVTSNVGLMQFDTNTISNNGTAAVDGDGVGFDVVTASDVGPVTFTNNTIDGNQFDGVSVDSVAPAGGTWDFTFDQNLSISGNQGRGINFILPTGLADLDLVVTDNAAINNNALGGINLALDQNNTLTLTSFFGNTISANGGPGVLLTGDDGSSFTWNLGDSTQALNTLDDNDAAGVAVDLMGTATGTLAVENTTISSTNDGATYGGDGLAIRLNEASTLPNLIIGDPTLMNTNFTGNAGDGIGIVIDATAQLNSPTVQNVTSSGNSADGLNVNRMGSGVVNNFVITTNSFTGNTGDGLDIMAQFALLQDEYNINNNTITGNTLNGIRFTAQGDGQLVTVLTDNVVENNLDDGVFITTVTVSAGDAARVVSSAAWTGNSFSFNGNGGADAGIDISGIHSLVIGVNDGNPLTFSNTINGNTGDGIEVNGANFVGGVLQIVDADISGNVTEGTADGRAGVDINGTFNQITISNSRIMNNLGDGVEIDNNNVTLIPSNYTLNDNIISFNGRDGVEFISGGNSNLTIGGTNTTLSQITDNGTLGIGGRGVDIIAGGADDTNTTVTINNTSILRNAQEGVYTILTASSTQRNAANRDSLASVALQSDGAITTTPFLNLNIGAGGGNIINNNGQPGGNIGGSGLVLRVGTTRGGDGIATPGGFATTGNGGVNANVQNNQLFGNFGADVFVQSFVSIGNSGNSGTAWTDQNENPRNNANDVFNSAGYQSDPLARLDLVFSNNSGEENAGTNVGAAYTNTDAVFKSRGTTNVGPDNANDGGADDNGPFGSGGRSRNAQRLAARNVDVGGAQLPPLLTIGASDTFLFPGLGQSTFRVNNQGVAGNNFGAGTGFIMDGNPFVSTVNDANGVGAAGGGPFGIDAVPYGWTLLP
ncbi:MAG: hypothetical protein SFV23_05290 [Planctomycetaceae bacterium]|nr:hypothetical protein [Planctomycetaceae bacterium]